MDHLIFAYGTLKESETRKALLDREVTAEKDVLHGFVIEKICLDGVCFPIAVKDPFYKHHISGEAFSVNNIEIGIIDRYESDAYKRIKVRLKSGRMAWLYVKP